MKTDLATLLPDLNPSQIKLLYRLIGEEVIGRTKPYKDGHYPYWVGRKDLRATQRDKLNQLLLPNETCDCGRPLHYGKCAKEGL